MNLGDYKMQKKPGATVHAIEIPGNMAPGPATVDWEQALRALILLGFTAMLLYLVISGRIRMYINPRFAILSGAAAAALFLMFVVQLVHLRDQGPDHDHCCHEQTASKWPYAIFIVPLALFLIFPDAALDASLAANRGLNLYNGSSASSPAATNLSQASVDASTASVGGGNPGRVPTSGRGQETAGQNAGMNGNGLMQVTDANFVRTVTALNQSPGDYAGREIAMLGFVVRDSDFAPQEFGLVRFVITCCTADASPEGFICESRDAAQYREGTWLELRGTLEAGSYDQQQLPVIQATSVRQVVQPLDPYVYP